MGRLPHAIRGNSHPLLDETLGLFSVEGGREQNWSKTQWWPIVWSSILYEIWLAWTRQIYGGDDPVTHAAILHKAWSRVIISGCTTKETRPGKFKEKLWKEAGFLTSVGDAWQEQCAWTPAVCVGPLHPQGEHPSPRRLLERLVLTVRMSGADLVPDAVANIVIRNDEDALRHGL